MDKGREKIIERIDFYKSEIERMTKNESLNPLDEFLALPMAKDRLIMWESILATYKDRYYYFNN
jgi:hypothetical protein